MKSKINYLILILTLLFASCVEQMENDTETPSGIIESSLSYFTGEVISKSIGQLDGIVVWEIKIQNDNSSILTLYWRAEPLQLLQIEGSQAPFDYDLSPGENLINFSTARTIAMGQVNTTDILHWMLKLDIDKDNMWVYTFEFLKSSEISTKVDVDASNGNILQID